jgi:hypothetical protein
MDVAELRTFEGLNELVPAGMIGSH